MSSLFVPLALVATFFAVVLVGIALEGALADRKRAVTFLETQVAPSASLRDQALSKPFLERALLPLVSGIGDLARRVTPADVTRRIAHKLVLAGSPEGWDAEKVAAFKLVGAGAGGAVGLLIAQVTPLSGALSLGATVFMVLAGFLVPGAVLGQAAANRQEAIRRALPDTMDLLTISVEAGLGFDAALAQVRRNVPGPLSQEIARLLQEMQIGVSRVDAFRHLADRTDIEELNAFVLSMIQADVFGVSVANVLRSQARELRVKRRQRAERKAMQVPVKLLFPLIFCILPAMFVVILGPGAIRILKNFFGIQF